MNRINKFFNEKITSTKGLFFSFLLSFLFIFPLLHANTYYEDDLFRIFTGQYVWEMLGRVFTYWLMHIVTFSSDTMLNVTPLPLILSFLVVAHLVFYVAENILKSLCIANILIAFCFVCNPYLLANLSYAYDCLHMVLGFHFSVIAYVKMTEKKYISVFWLLSAFLLYQPMGNIFLSLAFFSIIQSLYIGKTIKYSLILFIQMLALYIITLLCYLFFIKIFYLITPHVFQRSEQISLLELVTGIFSERVVNLIKYISLLYKNIEARALLSLCVFFGLLSIFYLKNTAKFIVIILSILGAFLSILGPMFLLKEGLITARVMTSLGTLLLILLYLNHKTFLRNIKFINYLSFFIICTLSWYHITLSFGYGNHLSLQRKYDEGLLMTLQNDILSLHNHDERIDNRWISLEGCTQTPKSVQLLEKLRPFYKQLNMKACTWRSKFILFDQMLGNFKFDRRWSPDYSEIKNKICNENIKPAINRELYSIYSHKNFIFISLGKIVKCNQ